MLRGHGSNYFDAMRVLPARAVAPPASLIIAPIGQRAGHSGRRYGKRDAPLSWSGRHRPAAVDEINVRKGCPLRGAPRVMALGGYPVGTRGRTSPRDPLRRVPRRSAPAPTGAPFGSGTRRQERGSTGTLILRQIPALDACVAAPRSPTPNRIPGAGWRNLAAAWSGAGMPRSAPRVGVASGQRIVLPVSSSDASRRTPTCRRW